MDSNCKRKHHKTHHKVTPQSDDCGVGFDAILMLYQTERFKTGVTDWTIWPFDARQDDSGEPRTARKSSKTARNLAISGGFVAGAERFELSTRGFGVAVDRTIKPVVCAFAESRSAD